MCLRAIKLLKYSLISHVHKCATIFGGFTSAGIFVMRLLQLPHQAYNSILRENRRLWCQDDRKHIYAIDRNDPFANNQLKHVITARSW